MKIKTFTNQLPVAVLVGFVVQAGAVETRFSNSGGDTSWINPGNWSVVVPGAGDLARLQNPVTADIDSVEVIGGFNFRGDQALGYSIVNVNNGGSLTSDGTQFNGNNRVGSDGDATLNINAGGTVYFSGLGIFEVGESKDGDVGYVNVHTGGTLQVSQGTQLGSDSDTTGNLLIDGGAAIFTADVAVGQASGGSGRLILSSGTLNLVGANLRITDNSAAAGELVVRGGTLTDTDGSVQIRDGQGIITQSGGVMSVQDLYVGHLFSSDGTMNMSGGSNTITGTLAIGNQEKDGTGCSGTLNMSGGWMDAATLKVGNETNTTGVLTLSGSNTYLKASVLQLGATGASVSSTIHVDDGLFQIHKILFDANSANESIVLGGGVLKLRTIDGATGFDDAVALVEGGVITWTNGALGTLASTFNPADADLFWTNGMGTVLYADTNGTHYTYMWAEAQRGVTYSAWISDYNLSNGDDALDANPDGDAMDNLTEFGLGGDPTNSNDIGILPVFEMVEDGGLNWFEYVYRRRLDADARGLSYEVLNRENLVFGSWLTDYQEVGTATIDDDFESVTNRIPMDGKSQDFTQLEIGLTE